MKTNTKYKLWVSATFVFLIAITGISVLDAVTLGEHGWLARFVLLSFLLLATALSALVTLLLLLGRKSWVVRGYGVFSLLWAASMISYDYNVVGMCENETERILLLTASIIVPILLGFGLVRMTLSARNANDQPIVDGC